MNRKGFTLIELIAVIVVLGIILVVTVPSLISAYKQSELKSEELFLNRLSESIDSYVSLNKDEIDFDEAGEGAKKGNTEDEADYKVHLYKGTINDSKITFNDIITKEFISKNDFINPGTKLTCDDSIEIEIYRDSDYAYCHKVKTDNFNCLTEEMKEKLGGNPAIDNCTWTWTN